MKKSYAKFIISAIMLVGGGNAFAQKWRTDVMQTLSREDMLRYYELIKKTPQWAKMDTIRKYKYNNMYSMLNRVIESEDTIYANKIKRIDARIAKLSKRPKTSDEDTLYDNGASMPYYNYGAILEAEEEKKEIQEQHNETKMRYINDAFVRCMIESDRIHKKR